MFTDIQAVGYVLDPEFWTHDVMGDNELMDAFERIVLKFYPDPVPLADGESEGEMAAAERATAKTKALNARAECERELLSYKRKLGVFGRETVEINAKKMSATDFWQYYGRQTPNLQVVMLPPMHCTALVLRCILYLAPLTMIQLERSTPFFGLPHLSNILATITPFTPL